ncbi:hypothetical protein BVI2075_140002 [Burkholderia vietnamiensis]|nr:hypothetical protein BVI2075_140002 [Burkholderia vietnamiensis]
MSESEEPVGRWWGWMGFLKRKINF